MRHNPYSSTNPGRRLPGEYVGDVDKYGRMLLDDKIVPDPATAPAFGRWRGGLIHPDRVRFVISREQHERDCGQLSGWVRSIDWWGRCHICDPSTD